MTWKISNLSWTVEQLVNNQAAITLRPEYQRQFVWNPPMMQNLIWCMLRGQDIPKFYFHNRRDLRPRRWDVVDGQQRIETIYRFIEREFSLSTNKAHTFSHPIEGITVAGCYFDELPEDMQTDFLNYSIIVAEIETSNQSLVIDQFLSLQYGKTLNGQEKRQASPGRITSLVRELGVHDFVKLAQVNKKREGEFEAVSRILYWEQNERILDTSGTTLDRFYIHHAEDEADEWKEIRARVLRTFNLLQRAFPYHHSRMRETVTFMLLYWLGRELLLDYVVDKDVTDRMAEWFSVFSETIPSVYDGSKWTTTSHGGRHNEERFTFMLNHFLEFFPDLAAKDPQRRFTQGQRRVIWDRAQGRCEWIADGDVCGLRLEHSNFDADHILPHSQGGKTTVENGRVVCSKVNRGSNTCPYRE